MVTLDLIATNVYNSVKAPTGKGFSFIEIWMIGVQIPLLLGIFEYGFILAMKKSQKIQLQSIIKVGEDQNALGRNTTSIESLDKMDKWTFFGSLTFTLIFNVIYWSVASNVKYK